MSSILNTLLSIVLALHGLIHLIGTAVYMRFASFKDFPYKTTLLNGRFDLGTSGIGGFGLVWLLTAVAIVAAAVGVFSHASWSVPVLLASTIVSLVLCVVDWQVAKTGAIIDIIILGAIVVGSRLLNIPAWCLEAIDRLC